MLAVGGFYFPSRASKQMWMFMKDGMWGWLERPAYCSNGGYKIGSVEARLIVPLRFPQSQAGLNGHDDVPCLKD